MLITQEDPKLLKPLSDKELLEALQKEKTRNGLEAFQSQFFNRFKGYVFKGASQRTRIFGDAGDFATDITQQTFITIFNELESFHIPETVSDLECTNRIKKWISQIANNHFNIEYARRKNIDSLDDVIDLLPQPGFDLFESLYNVPQIEIPNGFKIRLQEALNSIKKERDKHIILEYAREGCIETNMHLSTNTLEFLCRLYGTTPENIRQIKKRTLDKIKLICFQPGP